MMKNMYVEVVSFSRRYFPGGIVHMKLKKEKQPNQQRFEIKIRSKFKEN